MSTDEYVPSDGDLYEQIAKRQYEYDYTSPWEHLAPAPRRLLTQAARNTMEPIIARVHRDGAREALDGLMENMIQIANGSTDPLTRTSATITARLAGEYKLSVYPEETHE